MLLRAERAGKDPEMEPNLQFPNVQQPHFPRGAEEEQPHPAVLAQQLLYLTPSLLLSASGDKLCFPWTAAPCHHQSS